MPRTARRPRNSARGSEPPTALLTEIEALSDKRLVRHDAVTRCLADLARAAQIIHTTAFVLPNLPLPRIELLDASGERHPAW